VQSGCGRFTEGVYSGRFSARWATSLKLLEIPKRFLQVFSTHSPDGVVLGVVEMSMIARFIANQDGATAIEYGLIAALIAVVIITAVTAVGTSLSTTFTTVSGKIK
jgi:pilus assembly protein Flp/PilA